MVRNTYEVQNVGDLLREKRKQQGIDLKEIADHTKIRVEYLVALETGDYAKFASDVYAKGFLKKYAKYLGINPDRAAAMYRREQPKTADISLKPAASLGEKFRSQPGAVNFPRLAAIGLSLLLLVFGYYIFSSIGGVLREPLLELEAPITASAGEEVEFTTERESIELRGIVELGSVLELNGAEVERGTTETFAIGDLDLDLGLNTFSLVARNQFGQESTVVLTVIRLESSDESNQIVEGGQSDQTETIGVEPATEIAAEVSAEGAGAFLQVSGDGDPLFSAELAASTSRDFRADEVLIISTVDPEFIRVVVNNLEFEINDTGAYEFRLNPEGIVVVANRENLIGTPVNTDSDVGSVIREDQNNSE